ncbi:helix-turn-helix domain-containing protein [Spirosoma jeollabukense]
MPYLTRKILFLATYNTSFPPNRFQGIKLVVSVEGTFTCVVEGQTLSKLNALVINRNMVHSLTATQARLLIYYIDIDSLLAFSIQRTLGDQPWLDLSQQLAAPSFWQQFPNRPAVLLDTLPDVVADQVLTALFPALSPPVMPEGDWRVDKLVDFIDRHLENPLMLANLAPVVSLSSERVRHLFIEYVGVTLSQYVAWMRVKRVIQHNLEEAVPLGQAAHQFGFTDQAHFNKIFKRMFGLNPYVLLKNKRINWVNCPTG